MNNERGRLRIEVFQNGKCLGSFAPQGKDHVTIGRSQTADVRIPSKAVCGIHAMVRMEDKFMRLYDLGSKYGTYVQNKRVIEENLKGGSTFRLGEHDFRVSFLAHNSQLAPETSLFWKKSDGAQDLLNVVLLNQGSVTDSYHLTSGEKLRTGLKTNEIYIDDTLNKGIFVARKRKKGKQIAQVFAAPHFNIEVYNRNNQLISKQPGNNEYIEIDQNQKCRIIAEGKEIQINWSAQGDRIRRSGRDYDTQEMRKSLVTSFVFFLITIGVMTTINGLQEDKEVDLTKDKNAYFRIKKANQPAPAPAPAGTPDAAPIIAKQEPVAKPKQLPVPKKVKSQDIAKKRKPKKTQAAKAVSNLLSNLITSSDRNKKILSKTKSNNNVVMAAIGPVGSAAEKFQAKELGGQAAGTVNTKSIGKIGSGKVNGLNGFGGNGAAGSVGSSLSTKGYGNIGIKFDRYGAEIQGGIDREEIARVVKANIGQIKHCYERQLIIDPNLNGKLVAKWIINKDGKVVTTSVKKSTLGNSQAENCMLNKITGWRFPKPKGGGRVVVSYPFLFKAVN